MKEHEIRSMLDMDVRHMRVLLRLDINSPIDPETKKIVNRNRLIKSLPTLKYLMDNQCRIAIIAHQGDTLDYQNLIPLREHAEILTELTGHNVAYIDDVCGPAALDAVKRIKDGEAVILGNLRYLTEEISSFEDKVKLTADEMKSTWLVRSLAPHFNLYINDAFSAAHRNAPSMVAFQRLLPSAAGPLFFNEITALTRILEKPDRPATFLLGGAKISDAFGMMNTVLSNGSADTILTTGVTGIVFLAAAGKDIGKQNMEFLEKKGLIGYIEQARELLESYRDKIEMPVDMACCQNGERAEVSADSLPSEFTAGDIGEKTIKRYSEIISESGTIFINGPAGIYENPVFEKGTKELLEAVAASKGFSVIGGGDSVTAASKYIDTSKLGYVCTAGGSMIQFLSGKKLPLVEAMKTSL